MEGGFGVKLITQSSKTMKTPDLNLVHEWNVEPSHLDYSPSEYGQSLIVLQKVDGPVVVTRSAEGRLQDRASRIDALAVQRADLDKNARES